jgi:hypothetical protein
MSEKLPREVTSDLYGNMERGFRDFAVRHRAAGRENAALIADLLADTTKDVPAQLMQEFHDLYCESMPADDGEWSALQLNVEMEKELALGYLPKDATAFVMDLIRRMTGVRPS